MMKTFIALFLLAAPGWWQKPETPHLYYLYDGGAQLGVWDVNLRKWWDRLPGGAWSAPRPEPPVALPDGVPIANYGVETDKLAGGGERILINGRQASKSDALRALSGKGSPQLPDDKKKLRLTVIGPDADRQRVLDDLAKTEALAFAKGRYVVQDYAPDAWPLYDGRSGQPMFHTQGRPTIYLQEPGGKVLHRQDDYADGADGLARALRKADPSLRLDRDQDKRKIEPTLPIAGVPLSTFVLLTAGAGLIYLILNKGKKQ